jgi:VanZ family protein
MLRIGKLQMTLIHCPPLTKIAEECIQSLSPQRTFSLLDMVMSLLGISFGCWLIERKNKVDSVK